MQMEELQIMTGLELAWSSEPGLAGVKPSQNSLTLRSIASS
jgi:hypothetical protein